MKILEINKFNYVSGGADRHFLDVTALLKSKGHQVAIFSMHNKANEPSFWQKYFVSYVGFQPDDSFWNKIKGVCRMFYSLEAGNKICRLLDEFQPDLVHIHNIYHHLSPSILLEIKKRNIPIVMTIHDYEFISPDRNGYFEVIGTSYWKFLFINRYSFFRRIILVLKKYFHKLLGTSKLIDLFISPSEFTKKIFIKAGVPENRIFILPHFLSDFSLIQEKRETNEHYALYFGRICEEKGVNELIEMFDNISNLKLYIAGAPEKNFKMNPSANIKYLGKLEKEELNRYISKADFVISASHLQETFGLIALEAIGQGTPFIGFDAGAFREIINQGISGFILNTPQEMKNIIEKIADQKINFNREKIAQETRKRYNSDRYYNRLIDIFSKYVISK